MQRDSSPRLSKTSRKGIKRRRPALKSGLATTSDATLKLMQDRVEKEIKKLDSFTTTNFVPAEKGQEDCYAYVYPDKDDKIYLGDDFDPAPATGPDSKAGTLVHEMSHYNSVGGIDDVVMSDGKTAYGQKRCKNWQRTRQERRTMPVHSNIFVEGQ